MIWRFLKAGIMEEGKRMVSDEGLPQGGSASPLLANLYLHYALDLWFERRFRKSCAGPARLIRYADDFVVCFELQTDAERFLVELIDRLGQFGLEVEPSKTKILAFGPQEMARVNREGGTKPETFDFLGFTHYCSTTRTGTRFRTKRVTARKKFRVKLAVYKQWLKANRTRMNNRELWEKTCAKLRGHHAYYGVTDNFRGINRFGYEVKRILFKWLNCQGGRRRMNWEKFSLMEKRLPFPKPRIHVNLLPDW